MESVNFNTVRESNEHNNEDESYSLRFFKFLISFVVPPSGPEVDMGYDLELDEPSVNEDNNAANLDFIQNSLLPLWVTFMGLNYEDGSDLFL